MFNFIKKFKFDKKYLPILLFVSGVIVFSGVAFDQLYLSKKSEKEEKISQQQDSLNSKEGEIGEVAGVQEQLNAEESPTLQPTVKKQATPTNKPEVKSDSNGQSNNNSNQNSDSNSSNTTTIVIVTATPAPTNSPVPTSTPTPISLTPTPDSSPFEASARMDGNNVIIETNKLLSRCVFKETSVSGISIEVSGDGEIQGTNCIANHLNSSYSIHVTVLSTYGDKKSFVDHDGLRETTNHLI